MDIAPARWGRAVTTGALLITAALLAAACGSDSDDEASAEPDPAGAEVAADAFPVSVAHQYGETVIEVEPQRIVTVGLIEQDALLALGVVPTATTDWFGGHPGSIFPWATERLEQMGAEPPASLGESTSINAEAVAAQEPDLILAVYSAITEAEYETLSAIAPTIAPPEGLTDFGVPWQDLTLTVGRAIGRADQAEAVVADVEDQVAAAVAAHPEFEGAEALMATPYEGVYVYGPEDVRGRFLSSLGFELPPDLAEITGQEFGVSISQEQTEMLDADVIVWLDPEDGEGPLGGPLYDRFPVHTEGREVFLDSFDSTLGMATSVITVLSVPYLVDGLTPMLAAAIDGDPTTEVPTPD